MGASCCVMCDHVMHECDVWHMFTRSIHKVWHEGNQERKYKVTKQLIVHSFHITVHPVTEMTLFAATNRSLTSQEVCSPLHHLAPPYLTHLESVWG